MLFEQKKSRRVSLFSAFTTALSHLGFFLCFCFLRLCLINGMTDVISHILILEIDPAGGLIGVGSCLLQRLACGSDAQHPAAIGDDLAVLELGSRVEYEITILILDLLQTVDLEALLVR